MAYVRVPFFDVPQANGLRCVVTAGPEEVKPAAVAQNWINTLLKDLVYPGTDNDCNYYEQVTQADAKIIQLRTSYETVTFRLFKESDDSLVKTVDFLRIRDFVEQTDARTGHFADYGSGKTQIYFDDGMPDLFFEGQEIVVSANVLFNGTFTIEFIGPGTGAAEGQEVLVITHAWPGGAPVQDATVTTVYDIEPWDYFQGTIDFSDVVPDKYYGVFTAEHVDFDDVTCQTEPIEVSASAPDYTMLFEYSNEEAGHLLDYTGSLVHRMRMEAVLQWPTPGGERTVMETSAKKPVLLSDDTHLVTELFVEAVPFYLVMRLKIALGHERFSLDGTRYSRQEDVQVEYYEYNRFADVTVKLRMEDFNSETGTQGNDVDTPSDTILSVNGALLRLT